MYKHTIISVSPRDQRLGELASEVAAILAATSYVPKINFFIEDDENGRFARAIKCAGFIDYRSCAERLDVFVRANMSPRKTAGTIFHEVAHVKQWERGQMRAAIPAEAREKEAHQFAHAAPVGFNYQGVTCELLRFLTQWTAHISNYERAQRYRDELARIDPQEAAAIDVSSPEERRAKIRLEAQKVRRETAIAVAGKEAIEEFERWRKSIHPKFNPVLEDQQRRRSQC